MKFTAKQIAGILDGTVEGNPETEVHQLSKIEEGELGSISFLANKKYNPFIYKTGASIVIVNNDLVLDKEVAPTLIRVKDAYQAFSTLLEFYNQIDDNQEGIMEPVSIDKSVRINSSCYVGEFTVIKQNVSLGDHVKIDSQCYIGKDVTIGSGTKIHSGTRILSGTIIGENCIIHSGCVIGSEGFGFAPQPDGTYKKVPQTGIVRIGNNVDIGANSTIDKATLGATIINNGVKLDNQIQIAHNVEIGENTVIAAQVGIAGSTKIGKSCVIGGQAGFAGHLTIGNGVQVQGKTGVTRNIKDNAILQGTPAFDFKSYSKSYIHFKNLPKIIKRLDQIEKEQHGK
ncbi:UDP-3-O-(3-hydroxymyristoyl)glucosamine N-acyltransferase [Flavobacteriaceae bacterium]|uniref:UDP-3-O-(3-hydroxymyristoyl)glucosamine N-acyltransferase n=1 Tax=Candidatus Arcticimaribacter forsetii TaxID=2820661 RepID=UPI0020776C39|nr:UDP-3-O-(3-hydroxymyristoyl)glucosamine N-acyltransferase [Candidatus Arcticimaribacter forsetii]MDB2325505.1 UDP-3-O-(3-hydroxymyristoyl)glucosamine N-acyltransferase [Flavobacteriaceae bacterium]MDB2345729.1 UDP-3-O-(3-hydroxymyristoyl)glucosamine N-acyltransferase [Flavobacteriaceae bacterium]MDB2457194.1 UDP-3-O-(3-hydroxymyristoyl)glucosamine N-acyltransferase [Flavobacteriaceae bacterium]MDB4674403.1 UDP-3-O-(3-hydroxymyristoyl)glucosamine N-acyltransferase [Flavobacteriaceae bacterium